MRAPIIAICFLSMATAGFAEPHKQRISGCSTATGGTVAAGSTADCPEFVMVDDGGKIIQQPKAKPIAYTLILVTNGSDVKHSRGYETLRMCEEAESLARTGMTQADATAARERARNDEETHRIEFRAEHPPREPKNDFEKFIALGGIGGDGGPVKLEATGDGRLVQERDPAAGAWISQAIPYSSIKYAACIIEPEEQK